MAIVAVANTSTYIQGGIDYSTWVEGSEIVVQVKLYFRRTNAWSGSTYSSSTVQYICISGDPNNYGYSQTTAITVAGGQQNAWQGPFFTATRRFSADRSGNNIYVGWKTQDNASSYFTGSANATITLPQAYTAPSGLSITISEVYQTGAKFNVSLSSYGNPASANGRWIEAGIAGQNAWQSPYLRSDKVINTSSAQITVNNSSTQTQTLTIQPNMQYYYGGYAYNTQRSISQINGTLVTLAPTPTFSKGALSDTTAVINYSLQADGGWYAKNLQYSINGGSWVTATTLNTSSATTGSFTITGLTEDTQYTLTTRVLTNAGATAGNTLTFRTEIFGKFYGSVANKTKRVVKFYGSVNGKTKEIDKMYGSVNGKTKRVF